VFGSPPRPLRFSGGAICPNRSRRRSSLDGEARAYKWRKRVGKECLRAAGLGDPTPEVLVDLVWKTQLDHAIKHGQSYMERVRIAAALFDQRYGTSEAEKVKAYVRTEGDAEAYYYALRPQLYPTYSEWDRQVQDILDAQLEVQPIG